MQLFKQIKMQAPFPAGVTFGNSQEVVNQLIGGDADDWIVQEYGIPSVTSELGAKSMYSSDSFTVSDTKSAFEIISQN